MDPWVTRLLISSGTVRWLDYFCYAQLEITVGKAKVFQCLLLMSPLALDNYTQQQTAWSCSSLVSEGKLWAGAGTLGLMVTSTAFVWVWEVKIFWFLIVASGIVPRPRCLKTLGPCISQGSLKEQNWKSVSMYLLGLLIGYGLSGLTTGVFQGSCIHSFHETGCLQSPSLVLESFNAARIQSTLECWEVVLTPLPLLCYFCFLGHSCNSTVAAAKASNSSHSYLLQLLDPQSLTSVAQSVHHSPLRGCFFSDCTTLSLGCQLLQAEATQLFSPPFLCFFLLLLLLWVALRFIFMLCIWMFLLNVNMCTLYVVSACKGL